jgi:phosphoglucosamine mutase
MHPEEMRATVIRERANLGIAFDGDGDRVVMADQHGRLLDGNALLAVIGVDCLERGALPKNQIATTIMANGGLEQAIAPYGGSVVRTQVGDRYVVEAMREHGLTVGGESSGHILLLDHNVTGDGVIAALQVLAIMVRKDQPLSALAQVYQEMPESHVKVPLNGRAKPAQAQLDELVANAKAELGVACNIVIRPSGTEPIVRVMVQHPELRTADRVCKELGDKVKAL